MPLLPIVFVLVVVGLVLYGINRLIPMQPVIKTILNIVVAVAVCLWLMKIFGLWHYFNTIRV